MRSPYTGILLSLFTCIGSGNTNAGQRLIADPVKDFIADGHHFRKDIPLLRIDVDMNNDGYKETLLSWADETDGQQGNIWFVYKGTKKGYVNLNNIIEFHGDWFSIRYIGRLGCKGLVAYSRGGGRIGTYIAYVIKGDRVIDVQLEGLGMYDSDKKREALSRKYFGIIEGDTALKTPAPVKELYPPELAAKYHLPLIYHPLPW